ncbi:TPA: hypothetical protein DCW38_04000 [candidate division WOR-3 bacterium]|jgi:5-methylcytosine-specific restriction protein A|uniref:HNH nuclease domain-containing protein n=1 Tax=candidate division WOR-3 bacterium TaxID=2052148 RepID=A0A350H9V8_UNCW3|nr:hypothetical protein [candidate division WOR-3 bacterium]
MIHKIESANSTWKEFVYKNVVEFCNEKESRTFTLKDFTKNRLELFQKFRPDNQHVEAKIRQQLQFLRDEGKISFLDNSGHYTLRGIYLLEPEKEETKTIDLRMEKPEIREYLVETYVRKVKWAEQCRKIMGDCCIYHKCDNTFYREDGTKYIEIHHIIPLCDNGEDGLWNLSPLCAHHHKMSHFSDKKTKENMRKYLLSRVTEIVGAKQKYD